MHKYNSLFFSVLLLLTSCLGSAPSGIIKKQKMINLLTEIHIIDGSMYSLMQTPDTLYKYGTGKYLMAFKKYQTDSTQFKKSYKYYSSNPEELESMYNQIDSNLKRKSDSLNKIYQLQNAKDNKRRADSIAKIPKTTTVRQRSYPQGTMPPVQQQHNIPKHTPPLPVKQTN